MPTIQPTKQIDRIQEQFTRQRDAYIAQPDVRDERGMAFVVGLTGAGEDHRVLDVACGPGFLTRALGQTGARTTGLDATEAFLSFAREASRELPNIDFRQGDASRLPFEEDEFDIAVCRAAFHHFEDPSRVLAEMVRVTRPGGRILVADLLGNEDPSAAEAHDDIERLCDPTHVRAVPEREFENMARAHGLGLIRKHIGTLDHEVETWISHGGPAVHDADEIRRRFGAWSDPSVPEASPAPHLDARRSRQDLYFTHQVGVFVFSRESM